MDSAFDPSPARLSDAEAAEMVRALSLNEIGRRAHACCLRRHPEPFRTYVVDRNINYSNICTAGCEFCAFSATAGEPGAWLASREQILAEIDALRAIGGRQILLQGGLHPDLDLPWYEQLLRAVKAHAPQLHVHGFSPPEIHHLAGRAGLSVRDVLARLREAGLDSVPGGGAEILADRVRGRLSRTKCSADEWIDVMRQAHRLGMHTTATMMFGHIETDAERIEHLRRLRNLQDESVAAGRGRFTAFICWTFQPHRTHLGRLPLWEPQAGAREEEPSPALRAGWPMARRDTRGNFDGQSLRLAGSHEYLRMLALARLYLDNFDNLQASWVTQGAKVGQLALFFGANDMGSVMMEEKVVAAAGTSHRLSEGQIRHLIADAGWQPRRRNCRYELVE